MMINRQGWSMTAPWSTLRVFISSTFRDMHAERDHLAKVVFPALRERLERHRVHLDDIDLRWGLTQDQSDNDEILELCLSEIGRCKPFFLCILGELYGSALAQVSKGVWTEHLLGRSVTELEIVHAVLSVPPLCSRAIFCFRDQEALVDIPEPFRSQNYVEGDQARSSLLTSLKERIRWSGQPLVERYPARWDDERRALVGLETFGERVKTLLWGAITSELGLAADTPDTEAFPPSLAEESEVHSSVVYLK